MVGSYLTVSGSLRLVTTASKREITCFPALKLEGFCGYITRSLESYVRMVLQ